MFHSVRARLALWYATVFAAFLAVFAVSAYAFLRGSGLARIDEFLAESASAVAGAMEYERNAGKSDRDAIAGVVREFRLRDTDIYVLDRTEDVAFRARADDDAASTAARVTVVPAVREIHTLLAGAPADSSRLHTLMEGGERVRVYTLPYRLGDRPVVIGAVHSLRALEKTLREAELGLWFGIPILLSLATLGGYLLARKSMRPVAQMTDRAAVIGASSLHERLPVDNPRDELGRLASVFNALLDRLERAFEDQRRFIADASHEMRTPVAVISGESELALSRPDRRPEELRDALQAVRLESKRLRAIVEDLFLLARTQAGERPIKHEDLYLRDVLEECVRAARTLAAAKSIAIDLETGDDLPLSGDETLLKRLVMNLLDNAVKYTPDHGRVHVHAAREGHQYAIEVEDTGDGIPDAAQPHVFDRHFRAASAERGDGAGIGLAIAQHVARAHGGDVTLVRSDTTGTVFRISLPAPGEGLRDLGT